MKKALLLFFSAGVFCLLSSFHHTPGAFQRIASDEGQLSSMGQLIRAKAEPEQQIVLTGLRTRSFIPPKTPGTGGDNDFFGHGPIVRIKVEIFVKAKSTLYARVYINARELGGDQSSASGTREELIYFAGFGNEILSIQSPTLSNLAYTDDDHSEDYVGGNGRVRAGNAHAFWNENPSFVKGDDLVRFCVVVGDTDGQEIGTRTAIRVYFNPITITLKNPAPALLNNFSLNLTGVGSCGESTCSASSGAGVLHYYGFNRETCESFWAKERSVSHFVNWVRDAGIANMGIPPNVLRDKLRESKADIQLRMLTTANYFSEIRKIIKDQRRPVITLVAWGSRCVEDYYAPGYDSYGFGSAILHYVIIDGWDNGSTAAAEQRVWHVIDNGVRKNWSQEYFANVFFWKPENFAVEGVLYPQDVHPGNIVY